MKEYPVIIDNRNFIIRVGQNAKENWNLIDCADDFDLWFHLDDYPSGHVIIKEILNKKVVSTLKDDFFGYPRELIHIGSQYCKTQSKFSNSKVTVVYTTINNVKKGKDIGSVFIKKSKYIIL